MGGSAIRRGTAAQTAADEALAASLADTANTELATAAADAQTTADAAATAADDAQTAATDAAEAAETAVQDEADAVAAMATAANKGFDDDVRAEVDDLLGLNEEDVTTADPPSE